jgi:DNA-directed RNA polymerase alpha subunit
MRVLFLVSTFQAKQLLGIKKDKVISLLKHKMIDYVRDSENVYRISLESLIQYAKSRRIEIDQSYLDALKKKVHPWVESTVPVPVKSLSTKSAKPSPPSNTEASPAGTSSAFPKLELMGFSARALHVFRTHNIATAEQLTGYSAVDLMKFHNLGRKTLVSIRSVLKEYNLSLKSSRSQ